MKALEQNRYLKNLDLSDNDLNEDFAVRTLNVLKTNITLNSLKLIGNPIGRRRIYAVNITLEKNKNIEKVNKIPKYINEIKRISAILENTNKIQKSIK